MHCMLGPNLTRDSRMITTFPDKEVIKWKWRPNFISVCGPKITQIFFSTFTSGKEQVFRMRFVTEWCITRVISKASMCISFHRSNSYESTLSQCFSKENFEKVIWFMVQACLYLNQMVHVPPWKYVVIKSGISRLVSEWILTNQTSSWGFYVLDYGMNIKCCSISGM